jgi:hypothetical protein
MWDSVRSKWVSAWRGDSDSARMLPPSKPPRAATPPRPHFYRLHDNGWISIVTPHDGAFVAAIAREGEGCPTGIASDLKTAQQLADAALPLSHACSNECTSWFEVSDSSRRVHITTTCPRLHSGSWSYVLGDALFRLNTLSFWCLQCGRAWPATDEQRRQLLARVVGAE